MKGGQVTAGIPGADLAGAANSEPPLFSIGMVKLSSPGADSSGLKLGNSSDGGVTSIFQACGDAAEPFDERGRLSRVLALGEDGVGRAAPVTRRRGAAREGTLHPLTSGLAGHIAGEVRRPPSRSRPREVEAAIEPFEEGAALVKGSLAWSIEPWLMSSATSWRKPSAWAQ